MKIKYVLLIGFIGCAFHLKAQQSNALLNRNFWKSQPSVKEIKKKIKEGHSPTEMTSSMFDATGYAILENNPLKTVKFLLDQGNDINKITHDARTYIFWAAYKGNVELMEYLLSKGARTDLVDQGGYSILMFSAVTGQKNKRVYEICNENGMNIKTEKDRNGRNALLAYASRIDDFEMVDYFISQGLDIHSKDNNGNGIFHYAAIAGNVEVLKKLVGHYKVDFGKNTNTNENAFHFATRRSVREGDPSPLPLYQYLEGLGLDPGLNSIHNRNVLHNLAYRTNNLEMFKYFIKRGANPALVDEEGNNPLINAASRGNKEKIEFLLNHSHDINHQNNEGYSAMTRAFKYNSMEVVDMLAAKGARVDLVDRQGYDFGYHLVDVTRRDLKIFDEKMKFLTDHGYDPVTKQKDNSTLLHAAISKKNTELIDKLLKMGVDINAKDDNGQTILHHAAMQVENEDLLKFLLAAGADKRILTEFEESAYDLAKENELLNKAAVNVEFLKPAGR